MSDIFLSYSRDDRDAVEPLAEALARAGYSVWWDRNLTGGQRFLAETQAELDTAKAVLVVWTKRSVGSHWVADEASAGRDSGRLVPITLDGAMPPLGFRQFQVLDFSRWQAGDSRVFDELRTALSRLVGAETAKSATSAQSAPLFKPAGRPSSRRRLLIGGSIAAALGIAAVSVFLALRPTTTLEPSRLAFFGFAARGGDARSAQIADTATTEIFEALSIQQVNMAARSETVGTPPDQQFARARALGARFTLSGDIKPEPGKPGEVRIEVRIEDAGTRSTLWEDSFAADEAEPGPVAVRAATRGGDTVLCFLARYAELSTIVADAELLAPLATYCAGWRDLPLRAEKLRAAKRLTELAPGDAATHGRYAAVLLVQAVDLLAGSGIDSALLQEAERAFRRAEEIDSQAPLVAYLRYRFMQLKGAALADAEAVLRAGLDRDASTNRDFFGDQAVRGWLATALQNVGRAADALRLVRNAHETDPFNPSRHFGYVVALLDTGGEWQEAYRDFRARWPTALAISTGFSALILRAEDVYGDISTVKPILERPPAFLPATTRKCWQDLGAVLRNKDVPQQRLQAIALVKDCMTKRAMTPMTALNTLVRVGELDGAFELAGAPFFDPRNPASLFTTRALFAPEPYLSALRADPRFLPLMEKLGLMDYWRTTKSRPDICATEPAPFCEALR